MRLKVSASTYMGSGERREALRGLGLDTAGAQRYLMGLMAIYALILDSCSDGVHWTEGRGGDEMGDNGEIGPNHWSWWSTPRHSGFCLNQASAETLERIRVALDVPPTSRIEITFEGLESDAEGLGARILDHLRKNPDDRI